MKASIISVVLFLFIFNLNLSMANQIPPQNNFGQYYIQDYASLKEDASKKDTLNVISNEEKKDQESKVKVKKIVKKVITAYSSSPDETDSTPFITASNTYVRDGIVASNSLRFGTKIMIPEIFGPKVFIVEDRLHPKYGNRIDIWMPSKNLALQFGKRVAEVHIIED